MCHNLSDFAHLVTKIDHIVSSLHGGLKARQNVE